MITDDDLKELEALQKLATKAEIKCVVGRKAPLRVDLYVGPEVNDIEDLIKQIATSPAGTFEQIFHVHPIVDASAYSTRVSKGAVINVHPNSENNLKYFMKLMNLGKSMIDELKEHRKGK